VSGFDALWDLVQDAAGLVSDPAFYGAALWLLAGVFLVSGVAKLRKPALAAMAISDFGVVRKPKPVFGTALGMFEASLAVGLIGASIDGGAVAAGFAAVAAMLLWTFVVLIVRSLVSGDRFECYCFGSGDALSARTALRTGSLALLATGVAVGIADSASLGSSSLVEQALVGIGALSICALVGRIPDLMTWNNDPFGRAVDTVRR